MFHPAARRDEIIAACRALRRAKRGAQDAELRRRARCSEQADRSLSLRRSRAGARPLAARVRPADRRPTARSATSRGIPIKPLYTPRDWNGATWLRRASAIPASPDLHARHLPTMHRGRTWTQRQLIGLGTPADYNKRLRGMLDAGATAV